MKKYFTQCTILSFFLLLGAPGSGRVATDEAAAMTSEITVRVYNYAAVPEQRMARAQQHAAAVFAKADLQPRWVDCRLSGAEPIKDAACEEPLRPTDVVLRILPQKMAARLPVKAAICGFALPAKYLGFGIATVLYQRVDELVSRGSFSTDGNSARALMSFPWNKKELKEAAWGGLLFTRGQKRRIQAALLERIISPQDFQRDLSSRASR